jgi:hypothetical protein
MGNSLSHPLKISDDDDGDAMEVEPVEVEQEKTIKKTKKTKKKDKGKAPALASTSGVSKKADRTLKKQKIREHLLTTGFQDGSTIMMSDGTEAVINLSVGGQSIANKKTTHRDKVRLQSKKTGPSIRSKLNSSKRERDEFYTHDSATSIVIAGLHDLATHNKKNKRAGVPLPSWMTKHLSIDQMDWILGRLTRTGYSDPEFTLVPSVGLCFRWKSISSH